MKLLLWIFKSQAERQNEVLQNFLKHSDNEIRSMPAGLLGRLTEIETAEISKNIDLLITTGGEK